MVEHGGTIVYKANVKQILTEGEGENMKAVGVRLADGRVFRGKVRARAGAQRGVCGRLIRQGGEHGAVGVRLGGLGPLPSARVGFRPELKTSHRTFAPQSLISNATRWDTFETMMGAEKMPSSEKLFR